MISGLKNRDILTEKQQKIRNKELIGLPLTENEKRLMEGRIPIMSGVDDEVEVDELEEWLKEVDDEYEERWGYYGDEEIDVKGLTRTELEDLIYKVLTDRENQ